jgi:hypothetical protein
VNNAKPPDEKTTPETPPVVAKEATPSPAPPPAPKGPGITTHDREEAPLPAVAKETPPPPAPPKEKKVAKLAGEDDDGGDADEVQLPKKAFTERLDRARKAGLKELLEAYGVKDKAELDAKLAKLKEHDDKAEAERVAQLSREEKLAEENTRAKAEAEQWRAKYEGQVQAQEIGKAQAWSERIAAQYLDPDYVEDELPKLGKYLTDKYSDDEMKDLPESVLHDWFKERVAKKPKLGKDFDAEAAKAAPPKVPLGAKPPAEGSPVPPKGAPAPTDFRPKKGETPEQRRAAAAEIREKYGISV